MANLEIELIWQSDQVIAVNKPAGVSTQAPQDVDSLEVLLRTQLSRQQQYLAFPHRLDRFVSGVILVALTKKAARLLSAQFASRKTQKTYVAVVEGELADPSCAQGQAGHQQLRWDDYVRKIEGQAKCEICGQSDLGAKIASTNVELLDFDKDRDLSRLALHPITGRMHQLRLQTSHHGHPIVGDQLYGAANPHTAGQPDSQRILLHALRLGFHDPVSGRWREVEAPCPF